MEPFVLLIGTLSSVVGVLWVVYVFFKEMKNAKELASRYETASVRKQLSYCNTRGIYLQRIHIDPRFDNNPVMFNLTGIWRTESSDSFCYYFRYSKYVTIKHVHSFLLDGNS